MEDKCIEMLVNKNVLFCNFIMFGVFSIILFLILNVPAFLNVYIHSFFFLKGTFLFIMLALHITGSSTGENLEDLKHMSQLLENMPVDQG